MTAPVAPPREATKRGMGEARDPGGRVTVAHLGNDSTRCGALDPDAILHLIEARGDEARALEDIVYRKSSLLGVSGMLSDMRALRASSNPAAADAIALYAYRVVREIGSMAAALGGLDAHFSPVASASPRRLMRAHYGLFPGRRSRARHISGRRPQSPCRDRRPVAITAL